MDFEKNRKKILFIVLGIIVLASIIGFFLSKLIKPQIPVNKVTSTPRPIAVYSLAGQKGPWSCPSIKEFCTSGKQVTQNEAYIGFGTNIASGSAIYASFDGTINGSTAYPPKNIKGEKTNIIYLDNKQKGIRMVYRFGGDPISIIEKSVKAGDYIGKTGPSIENYNVPL